MTTRDENLDALSQAADDLFNSEQPRIDNETKFLRSVLQGRGAGAVGTSNLSQGLKLVQTSIQDFLRNS
jgi:hypothetical protein